MTFEQFVATRKHYDNLLDIIDDARWMHEPNYPHPSGYVYADALYVEDVQDWWPEGARALGQFCLSLGREQTITSNLTLLERKLYAWAQDEGYFQ